MIVPLAIWAIATVLHFALTAGAIRRILPPGAATLDERVFASVVGGVVALSAVLHATALTVGLGLGSGLGALALWHVATGAIVGRLRPVPGERASRMTLMERAALTVLAGIALTWSHVAALSPALNGPDAAHYHVPYAVNLAAGGSLFDLPATPHLYPMAGSLISAWFIVPVGTPLIVDLAMVMPCLILIASSNLIFRSATGLSGTAWATWWGLGLFSTPMFRSSSEGSADLWFTAGYVACVAVIVGAWAKREVRTIDLLLFGGAAGLLIGSKTAGVPALVLIGVAGFALEIARRLSGDPRLNWPRPLAVVTAGAATLSVMAGGVWLIRNWVLFGSPLAPAGLSVAGIHVFEGEPFARTTYLSVLGELQKPSFHLWSSARGFIAQWFGRWYLTALLPVLWVAVDLAAAAARRRDDPRWWARLGLLWLTAGAGAALVWLLIGAPWTALERSNGLTLRYTLPIAALLPLVSFSGLFPLKTAWYARPAASRIGQSAVMVGGLTLFTVTLRAAARGTIGSVPALDWPFLIVAGVLVGVASTGRRHVARYRRGVFMLALAACLAWWVPMTARNDLQARREAEARLNDDLMEFAGGRFTGSEWRSAWLAVHAAEVTEGVHCGRQRFFSLTRNDEPLALQPPGYGSLVFYAGRDVDQARRAGPVGRCDYVITTPALEATDKGHALAAALAGDRALRPFAATRELVILSASAK